MGARGTNKQQAMCSTHRDIWWPAWAHQQDRDTYKPHTYKINKPSIVWFERYETKQFVILGTYFHLKLIGQLML